MRTIRTVAFLLLAFTTSSALAGELKGRVMRDGKPAAGVTVAAIPYETPDEMTRREAKRGADPAPLATAISGRDGRFVLAVARPDAKFAVHASGPGTVAVALDGVYEGSETEELPEISLAKGEPLAGKVVDAAGTPVAGAEVTLLPGAARGGNDADRVPLHATTGADGTFRFDGASADSNSLSVEKDGLAPARAMGLRSGALSRAVVLKEGAPLSGTVLLPDRKTPAKGALVRFEGSVAGATSATTRWVETGEDGRFSIAHAPEGKGTLVVEAGNAGFAEVASIAVPRKDDKPLVAVLAPPSALEGRVVDAKTLRPVPRVKLLVRAAAGARLVRSGPDGRYRVAPLAAGHVQVRADEPRYVLWQKDGVPLLRGEAKALDIALTPGATLAGRVVDENGQPVAEAKGSLERGGQSPIQALMRRGRGGAAPAFRTGPDGSFRATRLAPGDGQKLTVSHPEFEDASAAGLALPPGGVKGDVRLVMRRGAAITGLVHDKDGNPVAAAEVTLGREMGLRGGRRGASFGVNIMNSADRPAAITGADGRFTLRGISPGEWQVEVAKKGWAREQVSPVKVSEERTSAPLDVTLSPGSSITGSVRSKAGAPLAGFVVWATPTGGGLTGPGRTNVPEPTGPDGAFFLDGLKAGTTYDLIIAGGGSFLPLQKTGIVAPAEGVEVVATGNGRITGRAVDEKTGRPLTDFTVATEPDMMGGRVVRMAVRSAGRAGRGFSQNAAVHDEDGVFALEDVPAGTWSVVVEAKGYQPARVGGVTVEEGATKENVEVRVSPGGALTGRALDARSGRGVPEVSVSSEQPSAAMPSMVMIGLDDPNGATTDADGRFTIDGLAPGRYKVVAKHPDYAEASETVEVKETGGTVDLRLAAGSVLGGAVLSEGRQPVPGAEVSLATEGDGGMGPRGMLGGQTATTDSGGRFRFEHLTAGRFSLTAALRSKSSAPTNVVLSPGESREDLLLTLAAGTTIRGVVSGLSDDKRGNVTVSGNGPEGWSASTRTGADGSFELGGAPSGAIILNARAGDFLASKSASKQIVVDESQPVFETEIVFEDGYTLGGRVTKAGSPLSGVVINVNGGGGLRGGSARSDDSGVYRLEGLKAGHYNVVAFGSGMTGSAKTQAVDVSSDQTLDIDFPSARISGTVVEAGSRRPLADVSVQVNAVDPPAPDAPVIRRSFHTDSNGRFSTEDLDPKTYTVTAQKPDFLFEKRDVTASEQGTDDLLIELTRGEGIGIEVKDGLYGIPLKGVFVRVSDGAQRAVFGGPVSLDSQGRGEIPSLKPGVYGLWMDADGYAPVSVDSVNVPSRTLAVAMTPGGTVELHAGPKTLATGSARLQFLTSRGTPYQMGMWSGDGSVTVSVPIRRFENFAPGSYTAQGPAGTQAFQVAEGQAVIVTLP